jgi:hypothetical protein
MPFAIFDISNNGLNLAVTLFILMLVAVWLALIVYTYLDARRRVSDPFLVACATIASFIPYIGTAVYAILRPPEFLEDAHERELEIRAAELRVRQLTELSCPNCEYPVEKNYLRCPNCRARLKDPCPSCGKPVDPRWALCPYCETVLEKPKPRPRPEPERAERREGPRPAPDARPSQARSGRGGRRAAAGASRGSSSKQTNRQAEGQRRKASSGSRRQPARTGSGETSEQRDDKQESGRPSGGEERPRPATAS